MFHLRNLQQPGSLYRGRKRENRLLLLHRKVTHSSHTYAQPAVQYNEPLQQPVQPQQPYYAPAAEQPAQQPYYAPAAEQPFKQPYYATAAEQPAQQPYYAPAPEQAVAGNAWQAEEQQSTFAPQSTYQTEQTYQQPAAQEPLYQQPQPVEQQPVVEPEPVVEETKPTRPPLYYFEEVKRSEPVNANNLRPGINRFQNLLKNQNRSNLR